MAGSTEETLLIWDLPLRLFHWCVVLCVAGSWVTHELGTQWFEWHRRFGYAMLVLVSFRIAWGIVGPSHARFASFLRGPGAVLRYTRELVDRRKGTTPGHSPLGGLAVIVILGLLLFQAVTGLFANDEIFNTGPLYGHVTDALSDRLTGLHKASFNVLLVMIGLHLAAIVFYALWKRVDLLRPMLTGRKPARDLAAQAGIVSQRIGLAFVLLLLAAAALWWVVRTAPEASLSLF